MIDSDVLNAAIQDSRTSGRTVRLIRQLTFRVVRQALINVYGDNVSTLCLQSSVAIQSVLESYGIRSELRNGAACLAKATVGIPYTVGWAGFWGEHHHVWVETMNGELVDYTISQLHRHPTTTSEDEPIPPLWWSPLNHWPPTMLYLVEGMPQPQLVGEDNEQLQRLLRVLPQIQAEVVDSSSESELGEEVILYGVPTLNYLAGRRHPWVCKAGQLQNMSEPMPEWIRNRFRDIGGRMTR